MFYSQFILAKKGPLGTIWIAAHLERKLKKNQVADTDIGVSVDSILFPEVPIALRLSSHLLLGVVRIYSRKVNYLFSDCSEALLKIKQAFRSTAVDLPPEESTAPYHSITLPETFDLDDFELPDTGLLSGNFVDHHVSTREQITLQDTLDGTGYSTSHFGLDERFGDGDASQIGLDLDEELFMGNNLSFQHVSVPLVSEEGLVHQGDVTAHHYSMDIDQNQYGHGGDKQDGTSNDLSDVLGNDRGKHVSNIDVDRNDDSHRLVFNIQTPDLNEVFLSDDHIGGPSAVLNAMDTDFAAADPPSPEFIESSHAPSTPRLMDEATSPWEKTSHSVNFGGNNIDTSITQDFGCPDAMISHSLMHAVSSHPELANLAQAVSPTHVTEPKRDSVALEWSTDAENGNGGIHKLSTEPDSVNISQVSPSSAFLPTEPIRDSLAPQCSVGVSPDAINGCNVIHPESANSEVANFFQVGHSSTSEFAETLRDSLAAHCYGGDTAAADVTCVESTPKSTGSLPTVLIHNEMSHLPTSDQEYIKGDANLPEMVPLDGLISSNMPTDMVPGHSSDINCNSFKDTAGTSNTGNLGHDEDAVSCHNCNLSTFSSDFHLRSCSSQLNQTNVLPLEDTISARNTPEISFREPGSSVELQGEYPLPDNVTETNLGLLQKSTCVLSDHNSGVNNPPSLSSNLISKDAQLDSWNSVLSVQFPEPERMLLAPTIYANLTNDLGQDTAEKDITESDGNVDRISSLRGQKRHLLNNTPVLQNGASLQVSGMSQKRRYNEYIPADDDLLASILVGRRTPALTMGPTPPLPKTNYLKRPRLTSRVGLSKRRKILLDDTMVLHADAIRQQLINTEDIRRLRKKAPCTPPEIWRIQKSLLEDEIFNETIFTDISADLNSLLSRRYDLDQNIHCELNENNSNILTSNDMELSRSSEIFRETGEREMPVHSSVILDRVDGGMQEHSDTTTLLDVQNCKNATAVDACLAFPLPSDQTQLLHNNQIATVSSAEAYVRENVGTELAVNSSPPENECEFPTDSIVSGKHHDGCFNPDQHLFNGDSLLETEDTTNDAKPASLVVEDMGVDTVDVISSDHPHDGHAKAEEFEALPDSSMHEVQEDRLKDSSTVTAHTEYSITDVVVGSDAPPDMTTTIDYQIETFEGDEVTVGEEPVMEKVLADDERPTSEVVITERLDAASYPLPFTTETERVPSAVGENSCMQEFNLDGGFVVESSPMDAVAVARESSDFCSAIDDNDTEFLNVDDGIDHDEEADNDVPNPEAAQSLANSGWSTRTRGVARYLKTMFDEESGRGRKSVAVDHLIAGKTRREASRMFFETLVLKTRDYIHVEQDDPFGYVTIKPRSKLLKSEF